MANDRLLYLFERYFNKTATFDERAELKEMFNTQPVDEEIIAFMGRSWQDFKNEGPVVFTTAEQEIMLQDILSKSKKQNDFPGRAHRVHFLKTAWFRYAAAIIIILTGLSLYYIFSLTPGTKTVVVQNVPPASGKNDIPPGFNRAVLTLSNGQKVTLDSATSETIKDGTLSIENNDGQLIYAGSHKNADAAVMNTMSTPKGGQYQLTLSDGTKVWLNAASSITYPTVFNGKTREVSITGEAYFEVTKNKDKQFIVKTLRENITVLGTSFNVNSYAGEPLAKTTLIEGSVRVNNTLLKPGQAYQDGNIVQTDIEQDIAWKNGVFNFNNVSLAGAARQLSRWYDIEFIYPANLANRKFGGKIGRNLTLLEVLELINDVDMKFRLEGKKIIVTP